MLPLSDQREAIPTDNLLWGAKKFTFLIIPKGFSLFSQPHFKNSPAALKDQSRLRSFARGAA